MIKEKENNFESEINELKQKLEENEDKLFSYEQEIVKL